MMLDGLTSIIIVLVIIAILVILRSVRVVRQWERGIVLTLGRYTSTLEPGVRLVLPMIQQMARIDMRVMTMEVPPQDVISKDNVSVKVTAIIYARVVDGRKALLDVVAYRTAVEQLAPAMLRSALGAHTLDQLLQEQDMIKAKLKTAIDDRTEAWGIKVDAVEIRSLDLEANMIRSMAQEAEAERGRRARVITAKGEAEAAEKLAEAAETLARNPVAVTLRSLATLKELGADASNVIVFPISAESFGLTPAVLGAAIARTGPKDGG